MLKQRQLNAKPGLLYSELVCEQVESVLGTKLAVYTKILPFTL